MKLKALWFASLVAGCGLVQVNGKPLGGNSPSSSSSSSSNESTNEETKQASTETKPSPKASSSPAAKPASASQQAETVAEANETGKKLEDISVPDEKSKRQAWTPLQQYWFISDKARRDPYIALLVADELGDKLSQAGRVALIARCWEGKKDATAAALWAACGHEIQAFDANALQKELQREGIGRAGRDELLAYAKEKIELAKEYGAAVMEAAKDDPGVAAVVEMGKASREEWKAFASTHGEALALLGNLEDLFRQDKNGLAGDCIAKTQPAMEKVVRATNWRENDTPKMPNEFYMSLTPNTTEAHIATAAWASCVALVHEGGKTVYAAAYGRRFRRGPRTLTISKLFSGEFKPKFASRSLEMASMTKPGGDVFIGSMGMGTPTVAKISKLVKKGEETTIEFDPRTWGCNDWEQTNKFRGWDSAGTPMYEAKCKSRGWQDNPQSDVTVATVFTNGLTPGVQVTTEYSFPIVATKGDKYVAAFGIKL